jgi:hypothetical protein
MAFENFMSTKASLQSELKSLAYKNEDLPPGILVAPVTQLRPVTRTLQQQKKRYVALFFQYTTLCPSKYLTFTHPQLSQTYHTNSNSKAHNNDRPIKMRISNLITRGAVLAASAVSALPASTKSALTPDEFDFGEASRGIFDAGNPFDRFCQRHFEFSACRNRLFNLGAHTRWHENPTGIAENESFRGGGKLIPELLDIESSNINDFDRWCMTRVENPVCVKRALGEVGSLSKRGSENAESIVKREELWVKVYFYCSQNPKDRFCRELQALEDKSTTVDSVGELLKRENYRIVKDD